MDQARCEDCEEIDDTVEYIPCPYAEDVCNKVIMTWLCKKCSYNRSMDI